MKKIVIAFISVLLAACLLVSCDEEQTMLDKLNKIEKGWTMEQVEDLLGEPDRELGLSSCIALEYTIDNATTAIVYYGGDHLDECFRIQLKNTETGEYTEILE